MAHAAESMHQTIFPAIRYSDARAAIAWLGAAFGAEPHVVYDADDGTVAHAELLVAGNLVMLGNSRDDAYPVRSPVEVDAVTAALYVALADAATIDALHERARACGATVTKAPYETEYGSREFSALDLEGHPWTFGTYRPSLSE